MLLLRRPDESGTGQHLLSPLEVNLHRSNQQGESTTVQGFWEIHYQQGMRGQIQMRAVKR